MNKPYLNIASNRLFRKSGIIFTSSGSPTYIGSTMRAIGGEIKLASANSDYIKIDNFLNIPTGGYIEWRIKFTTGTVGGVQIGAYRGSLLSGMNVKFSSNTNLRITYNGETLNSAVPTILTNTYYTIKIESGTNTITAYLNGIQVGTKNNFTVQPSLSLFRLIGAWSSSNVDIPNNISSDFTMDYIDYNGVIFNFNETGNDPIINTAVYYK